jgi:hypothetical protein
MASRSFLQIPSSFALAITLYREIISFQMKGKSSDVTANALFQDVSFQPNSTGSSRLMHSGLCTDFDVPNSIKRAKYFPNLNHVTFDGGLLSIFCFGLVIERLITKTCVIKLTPILALGVLYMYDLAHEDSHITVYFSFLLPILTVLVLLELWKIGCFGLFHLIQRFPVMLWTTIIYSLLDFVFPNFALVFFGNGGLLFLCSSTLGKKVSACPKRVVSIILLIIFAVLVFDHCPDEFHARGRFLGMALGKIRNGFVLGAQALLPFLSLNLAIGFFSSLLETAANIVNPPFKSAVACSCTIYSAVVSHGLSEMSFASTCLFVLMFMGKVEGATICPVSASIALAYFWQMVLLLRISCRLATHSRNQWVFLLAFIFLFASSFPAENRQRGRHMLAAQTFVVAMVIALGISLALTRDKTRTKLEGQLWTTEEREAAVRRRLTDCERQAEWAALESLRAQLDRAEEPQRLAGATQAVDSRRAECRRLEAELELAARADGQQRQRRPADADAELAAAAELRRLAAAAADADARLAECRRAEAGLNALRLEVERQRTLLASESAGVASARQRLADAAQQLQAEQADCARAAAQLEAERRELERRQDLLQGAERRAEAEQRRLAAVGDAVEAKWAETARLGSELKGERREMALAQRALAEEQRSAEAVRRLLTAELEQGRRRLQLQEERLEAQRQAQDARAREQQAAVDLRLKEALEREERVRAPPYWLPGSGGGLHIEPDPAMAAPLQARIRQTAMHDGCAGAQPGISRARVTRVLRVENRPLWALYQARRAFLRESMAAAAAASGGRSPPPQHRLVAAAAVQPGLERIPARAGADELVLWHGTSHARAQAIAEHGFDARTAADDGLYGAGCYFTDLSCKAHQYSAKDAPGGGEKVLVVCRVAMGWTCPITGGNERNRRAPMNPATPGRPFDSIFGQAGVGNWGKQLHNEFVLFEGDQAYPEYLVYYIV